MEIFAGYIGGINQPGIDFEAFFSLVEMFGATSMCMEFKESQVETGFNLFAGNVPQEIDWSTNRKYINIHAPTMSKGRAVELLALILQVPMDHVFVAGNDNNDISMFKTAAGTKVYVGNECPKLEELCTVRTENPDTLADMLEYYLHH